VTDIFISYSQADRGEVALLAAYLEAEGWSVWFDTHLTAGDVYRDEIMKELVAARCVIVLWTKRSIGSEFVRAEAGRAKALSKLIPIKSSDVAYSDIPLPFGEMHTENATNLQLVRAAVVGELAKPQVQQSELTLAGRTLKYQALTWVGIVGGALTLFSNLKGVLELARWARELTAQWRGWTAAFFEVALKYAGIPFNKAYTPQLSIACFGIMLAIGARRSASVDESSAQRRLSITITLLAFVIFCLVTVVGFTREDQNWAKYWTRFGYGVPMALLLLAYRKTPVTVITFCGLFLGAYFLLFDSPTVVVYPIWWMPPWFGSYPSLDRIILTGQTMLPPVIAIFGAVYFLPSIMLMICPLGPLTKRLTFVSIGFLILVVLNQLSVHAPSMRDVIGK